MTLEVTDDVLNEQVPTRNYRKLSRRKRMYQSKCIISLVKDNHRCNINNAAEVVLLQLRASQANPS